MSAQRISQSVANAKSARAAPVPVPPMIFFNIGWMRRYAGAIDDDPTLGRHGYLKDHRHGHESFNFAPKNGRVHGYQPKTSQKLKIENLGAERDAAEAEGVLVLWMALEPKSKRTLIVGWYKNATVHREAVRPDARKGHELKGERLRCSAEAAAADMRLLPVGARTFEVPSNRSMQGGFGQSTVWYGGNDDFRQRVWNYVRSVEDNIKSAPARKKGRSPRNTDPELRREVERIAVDHATSYFKSDEGGGYLITSVETDGCGWDLEATRDDQRLLIEVKGLSGSKITCELTPNEYEKAKDERNRRSYVIYIVSECLSGNPIASIFRFQDSVGWTTADGRLLDIQEKTGAVLKEARWA